MTDTELRADIEKYHNMLYRLACSCTGDFTECEDIVWETFIKLYTSKKQFPSDECKKAWLIRVTVNRCRSYMRIRRRMSSEEPPENAKNFPETEEAILLRDALKKLKPDYRAVIYLHYYEGKTAAEIGKILKISVTAVTTRLQRGRKSLREFLEDDDLSSD